MKRIWEAMGAIIVTMFALYLLYTLIKPYTLFIILAVVFLLTGRHFYQRARRL